MNCITLAHFRASLYACFPTGGDTLLNIVDALATETAAKSLPELSLSAFFPRQWSSIYQGLQNARIDRAALRRLFAAHALHPLGGQRLVLGRDARSILRPCSKTAEDRTYVPASNLPKGSTHHGGQRHRGGASSCPRYAAQPAHQLVCVSRTEPSFPRRDCLPLSAAVQSRKWLSGGQANAPVGNNHAFEPRNSFNSGQTLLRQHATCCLWHVLWQTSHVRRGKANPRTHPAAIPSGDGENS